MKHKRIKQFSIKQETKPNDTERVIRIIYCKKYRHFVRKMERLISKCGAQVQSTFITIFFIFTHMDVRKLKYTTKNRTKKICNSRLDIKVSPRGARVPDKCIVKFRPHTVIGTDEVKARGRDRGPAFNLGSVPATLLLFVLSHRLTLQLLLV